MYARHARKAVHGGLPTPEPVHAAMMEGDRMEKEIINFIGSLGFPIAACIYLFALLNKERESHKAEVDKLVKVIEANNQVLIELKTLLTWWVKGGNDGTN